ncbi:MAG: quinolinate synthase NadA [Alistipes sp.]|nr:quinolinate synthase NadA [Alistipes sp.]
MESLKCANRTVTDRIQELSEKIEKLKREKHAVILAHYYTLKEVQQVADFTGDSLALSEQAARIDAPILLFAGVRFMAETAKVLSPDKKVLLPEPEAGCSLADSCRAEDFAAFLKQYPGYTVVSYVNTSVEVKALTDICCTSSNAVEIIRSLPAETKILFAPDRNLGNYIQRITGRPDMVVWDGACGVHEEFSVEKILALKRQYPEAKVLAHPECKQTVLLTADYVGSTAALLRFASTDPSDTFIVVTEAGILYQMERENPHKRFIAAPPMDSTCGCNECAYMKMITLEKIYRALEQEAPEVNIEESVRVKAEGSIRRMLEMGKKK